MVSKLRKICLAPVVCGFFFGPTAQLDLFGKEWVGGGGLIENEFVMVWQERSEWLKPCLSSPLSCQLSEGQQQILAALPYPYPGSELRFVSFSEHQELYRDALGTESIISTQATIGSPIYINLDNLYADHLDPFRDRGVQRPISQLVGAMLFQYGLTVEQAFEISRSLGLFWSHRQTINHLGQVGYSELSLSYFNSHPITIFTNDHESMVNITPWIHYFLRCDTPGSPVAIEGLANTYWYQIAPSSLGISTFLNGQIKYTCLENPNVTFMAELSIFLTFRRIDENSEKLRLHLEESKVDLYSRERLEN
jgi:hypothetical protein